MIRSTRPRRSTRASCCLGLVGFPVQPWYPVGRTRLTRMNVAGNLEGLRRSNHPFSGAKRARPRGRSPDGSWSHGSTGDGRTRYPATMRKSPSRDSSAAAVPRSFRRLMRDAVIRATWRWLMAQVRRFPGTCSLRSAITCGSSEDSDDRVQAQVVTRTGSGAKSTLFPSFSLVRFQPARGQERPRYRTRRIQSRRRTSRRSCSRSIWPSTPHETPIRPLVGQVAEMHLAAPVRTETLQRDRPDKVADP